MGMSGGGSSSSQTTKPLTPQEMQAYYNQALSNLAPLIPGARYQAAPGGGSDPQNSAPVSGVRAYLQPAFATASGQSPTSQSATPRGAFGIDVGSYVAPVQQTLTGGDYGKLEAAYSAPLDRQKALDIKANDQAMADRGVYTSLNAIRANNDVNERYIPQYAAATGQAVAMKANELAQGNQMAMANATAIDNSKWRPADYLGQLWGMGKGSSSTGSSGSAQGGFTI